MFFIFKTQCNYFTTCYKDNKNILGSSTKMTDEKVFKGQIDRFKGVTVNSNEETKVDIEKLSQKLQNSIEKWKDEVELKISITNICNILQIV